MAKSENPQQYKGNLGPCRCATSSFFVDRNALCVARCVEVDAPSREKKHSTDPAW
jgi:hypothetical protein